MNATHKFTYTALAAAILFAASTASHAGMSRDDKGNVGYDTADECDAAVADGSATFYKSHTTHPPLLRKGRSEEHTSELQSRQSISYAVFCL